MATAKKAAKKGAGEEVVGQEGRRRRRSAAKKAAGEEGRQEGGEEGRQEVAAKKAAKKSAKKAASEEGGEEGASARSRRQEGCQEGRRRRRPRRRRQEGWREEGAAKKAPAKKAPAKKARLPRRLLVERRAQRAARGTGEDGPQPASCLAVPDRQQALSRRAASVDQARLRPGFFIPEVARSASAHDLGVGEAVRRHERHHADVVRGRLLGGAQRLLELGVRLRAGLGSRPTLPAAPRARPSAGSICWRACAVCCCEKSRLLSLFCSRCAAAASLLPVPPAASRPGGDGGDERARPIATRARLPGRVSMVGGLRCDSAELETSAGQTSARSCDPAHDSGRRGWRS